MKKNEKEIGEHHLIDIKNEGHLDGTQENSIDSNKLKMVTNKIKN